MFSFVHVSFSLDFCCCFFVVFEQPGLLGTIVCTSAVLTYPFLIWLGVEVSAWYTVYMCISIAFGLL